MGKNITSVGLLFHLRDFGALTISFYEFWSSRLPILSKEQVIENLSRSNYREYKQDMWFQEKVKRLEGVDGGQLDG